MFGYYLGRYWAWAGGNIGALPLEAMITAVAGLLLRKPLSRALAWLHRERDEILRQALHESKLARQIAADTYLHATGQEHPHAPGGE